MIWKEKKKQNEELEQKRGALAGAQKFIKLILGFEIVFQPF